MIEDEPVFFIAAPFGNYIKHPYGVNVIGTYTYKPRKSRFWTILQKPPAYRTVQGYGRGWTNKLGLPNPGINHGLQKITPYNVLSIAEIERGDFRMMDTVIPEDQSLELNLSCPNLGKTLPWDDINIFFNNRREYLIAKVSPLTTPEEIQYIVNTAFKYIHFSNTLPVPKYGGLSGKALIPYTLRLIGLTREISQTINIIAGGGVYDEETVHLYMDAGAQHISLGSIFITKPYTAWRLLNR